MGKRRPAPKPTNLRILHGEKRYRINQSEPKPPVQSVDCPEHLSDEAKEVWNRLAPDLRRKGLLTTWDSDAFAVYCEAVIQHRRASSLVESGGILVKSVKNPALQVVRDMAQTIRAYAQE